MIHKKKIRLGFLPLLLIPLGLALYMSALGAPFAYDDRGYILQNDTIRSLSNFIDFSGTRYVGFFSFALNYAIGGYNPFDYHLVNILIHITNAILVLYLVTNTFNTPVLKEFQHPGASPAALAFAVSVIFISHPVETQAVTYVTQRFASLATMFYLLAVLLYLKARLSWVEGAGGRAWGLYALSLFSTLLAMKTKEITFTIPFVIVLYDFLFFPKGESKRAGLLRIPFYLTLLIIPLTLLGPDIFKAAHGGISGDLLEQQLKEAGTLPRYIYILTQFKVIVTYTRLLFFPSGLSIDYDYPLSRSLFEPATFFSLLFLVSVAASSLYALSKAYKRKDPYLLLFSVGIFWFFITLSVESFMVPIQDVIFEQRVYLPSVGFILGVTSLLFFLFELLKGRIGIRVSHAMFAGTLIALVLPPFAIGVHTRNRMWGDELLLLNDAIEKSPGKFRLYYAKAAVFLDRRDYVKALDAVNNAISLHPVSGDLYNMRGLVYTGLGEYDSSILDFTQSISLNPEDEKVYYNRGLSYEAIKSYDLAIDDFTEAVRLNPKFADAYNNRAVIYSLKGDYEKSLADVTKACSLGHSIGCENKKLILENASL